tara:strand:- start:849 stop:1874 length:1026 start_codon:yes stop_codon:yes gene_type:complete
MENGLKSILRKKERTIRKEIPKKIINDDFEEIPDKIRVIYENKINTEHLKEIIIHRLKKLNEVKKLETFISEEKKYSEIYHKEKCKDTAELYLDLCSKYVRIERIKNISTEFKCKGCGVKLDDLKEEREGVLICDICNCINSYLVPNQYTRDIEKNIFYLDEDTNNFLKILDKFEGKTSLILPDSFFDKLDEYFVNIGFPKGEEIRKLPLNEKKKKNNTNRKMLWTALEKIGYSQYYDETSYITNIYWGWELPSLKNYKDQILKDYQNTQHAWNNIKVEYKRTASLGTQYRIYVHLVAAGYPYCEKEDFKIQENVESLRLHNDAWKKMCEICNLDYKYVSN